MKSKVARAKAPSPAAEASPEKAARKRQAAAPAINPMWARLSMWCPAGAAGAPADPVLPKASAGAGEDPLEQDADRMAEEALRAPLDAAEAAPAAREPAGAHAAANGLFGSSGRPLEEPVRGDLERRFGHDLSPVRVHTGRAPAEAARHLGAVAFSVGQDIAFSEGAYSPYTTPGKSLLAHEVAHTVQARQGLSQGRIQRRRVPSSAHLTAAVPLPADPVGLGRARVGLARALSRTWAALGSPARGRVNTRAAGFGLTYTDEASLRTTLEGATRDQLLQFAEALRAVEPRSELGDPALIDIGVRPGTRDAPHLTAVVGHANTLFDTMLSGSHDRHLEQVFGPTRVAAARARYANGKTQMNTLHAGGHIVTDRSGYTREASLGGLSGSDQIAVASFVFDQPQSRDSRVTLLHEAMHAGNNDVGDEGYIEQPSFTVLPELTKLGNAAHYEVVPRRILGMAHAFQGVTFTPAGTGGTPALTLRQQAIHDATEMVTNAWTAALNLHTFFVRVFRNPSQWATLDLSTEFAGVTPGTLFSGTLPFWSKVEMLTMHERLPAINPAGADAVRPVTIIDIALSEGLVHKLGRGMSLVPGTESAAAAFETAHATAAERAAVAAAATPNVERDLLVRLVLRAHLGSITGNEARDLRVITRLDPPGAAADFSDMLTARPPSAFP